MKQELKRVSRIYPWYSGLSGDLMFYIAISSIWLTEVKDFSAFQVTLLTTVSSLFGIILQIPILRIIKKIGNTTSIRVGSFFLLLSSILITFCTKYNWFIIAMVIYETAFLFKNMGDILIKNNMKYLEKGKEFVKLRSKTNTIYAVVTAIIALIIGGLFNIFEYLPMLLCILNCLICFLLSFYIFDIADIKGETIVEKKETNKIGKTMLITNKLVLAIMILYGVFYGVVYIGQHNSQLLIQFELKEYMTIQNVATYLGIIIFISRIARIIANISYPSLYKKLKNKVIYILSFSLGIAFIFVLVGFYLCNTVVLKFLIMTIGFSLILMVRDPIKLYMQNLILDKFDSNYHQTLFAYLTMFRKIGQCIFGAIVSCLLIKLDLQYVVWMLLCISVVNIFFSKKMLNNNTI